MIGMLLINNFYNTKQIMVEIKFKKLVEDAQVPQYAHDGDIGMDVYCTSVEYDETYDQYIYHTGLACESEEEIGIFAFPRSSNCKTEAYLTNGVGIIDSALYRGEIQLRYKNRNSLRYRAIIETILTYHPSIDGPMGITFKDKFDEIFKRLKKRALEFAPYEVGDRIGQIVPMHIDKSEIKIVNELSDTVRGEGGFGSTGTKEIIINH